MAQENVEVVRDVYARWGRGDFQAPLDFVDPNVQSVWASDIPDADVDVGLEALGQTTRRWLAAWDDLRLLAEEFRQVGDSVLIGWRSRSGIRIPPPPLGAILRGLTATIPPRPGGCRSGLVSARRWADPILRCRRVG